MSTAPSPLGLQVLRLVARGLTTQQAAVRLGISTAAAGGRLRDLYRALGARCMAHAVVIASIDGLLIPEDLRAAYGDRRVRAGEEEG